jgi:hypothetical protein
LTWWRPCFGLVPHGFSVRPAGVSGKWRKHEHRRPWRVSRKEDEEGPEVLPCPRYIYTQIPTCGGGQQATDSGWARPGGEAVARSGPRSLLLLFVSMKYQSTGPSPHVQRIYILVELSGLLGKGNRRCFLPLCDGGGGDCLGQARAFRVPAGRTLTR